MSSILVVDDDAALREVISLILREAGYQVEFAQDGVEAIASVARAVPDLILLDLSMPRLDGWGVLASLRQTKTATKVIVLSSNPDVSRAEKEGALSCLGKPFRPAELLLACTEALRADPPDTPGA